MSVHEHKFTGSIAAGRRVVNEIVTALITDAERDHTLRGGGVRCFVSPVPFLRIARHLSAKVEIENGRDPKTDEVGEQQFMRLSTVCGMLFVTMDSDAPEDTFTFVRAPATQVFNERDALERVKRTLLQRIEIAAKNGDGNATLSLMMAYEKAREMGGG